MMTSRQDILAALRKEGVGGNIGSKVLAPLWVTAKKGAIDWVQADLNDSAVTNRAEGGTVSADNTGSNLVAFECGEYLKRKSIDKSIAPMRGGMDRYIFSLAQSGTLAVEKGLEAAVAAAIMPDSATNISGDILAGLRSAAQSLSGFGRIALVGGASAMNLIRADTDMADALKATGVPITSLEDVRGVGGAQLAAAIGANLTLEATGEFIASWPATRVAIVVLPSAAFWPSEVAQVGRVLSYQANPEQGNEWLSIETGFSTETRSDVVDAVGYATVEVQNSVFVKELELAAS